MLDVEFAELSDTGPVRDRNEDYLGCALPATPERARTHGWLFALADGVGGHDHGEVAARLAIETLVSGFRERAGTEPNGALLKRLGRAANLKIFDAGMAAGGNGARMATTLVACALRHDRATVAHAGDSRCYLIRNGRATALTRDHTFSSEQALLGLISAFDVGPRSCVLSRSLGAEMFVKIETAERQVMPGDVLLLCSDGLHRAIGEADIVRAVEDSPALPAAARDLVALANQRDGGDNVSLQLIRVRGVERVGMYRRLRDKLR